MKRSRCAAGHKAMFNDAWGGLPAKDFLAELDPRLGDLRDRLYKKTYTADVAAGALTKDWAKKLGLPAGHPGRGRALSTPTWAPSAPASDTGRFVKIIGTSTCDICVWPAAKRLAGHPRPVRHRRRLGPAGLPGARGRAVGGRRHLQLVRERARAGRAEERLARGPDPGGRRPLGPGNRASSPLTGTTATGPSSSTSG